MLRTLLLAGITAAALVPFLGTYWLDRQSLAYTFRGHFRLLDNFCGIKCVNGELWLTLGHNIPPSDCAPPGCGWESRPGLWDYRSYYLAITRHETGNVWEGDPTSEELTLPPISIDSPLTPGLDGLTAVPFSPSALPPVALGPSSGSLNTRDWSFSSAAFSSGEELTLPPISINSPPIPGLDGFTAVPFSPSALPPVTLGPSSGSPKSHDWSFSSTPFPSRPEPQPRAKSIYAPTLSYFGCIAVQKEIDYRHCPWVYIVMPVWVLSLATGIMASLAATLCGGRYLLILRRARRVRAGFCGRCGYDLRASLGNCPECGAMRATCTTGSQ
jgi:hypothetical protein